MGLLGKVAHTAVKTAVISGTASAVHGRVDRRQAEHFADRDQQIAATRGAGFQQGAQQVAAASAQPPPPQRDTAAQLRDLAELKQQGLLTDEEFASQKAKILGQ